MIKKVHLGLLLSAFLFSLPLGTLFTIQWGKNCPHECQCQVIPSKQTPLGRWKQHNEQVKIAMCVFNRLKLNTISLLPEDTQALTFLQTPDSSDITLTNDLTTSFQRVNSIDMQGSPGRKYKLHMTHETFRSLPHLKYLSLQRVNLTGAEKVFSKLSSLEVLHVVYCSIGYIKWEMLDGLSSLKELYLVQSGIKELSDFAFYGAPHLRRLFLSHNDLFDLEASAFIGLLKLEHLDLSSNHIGHLSGLTFPPMPHLQWLELKHNPIKVIFPHCFQYLNGTQHLTIGHKLQAVHLMKFSFRGLYSLMFLHIPNIDNDALVEHTFYDLRALMHLNLQGRIRMLTDRAFNGAHRILQKLILHDCNLIRISENAFYGLENLITLDLSMNMLKYLPAYVFEPLKNVQEVILSQNKFETLHGDVFLPLTYLKALRLDANPWNCTCEIMSWKKETLTRVPRVTSVPCANTGNSPCTEFQVTFDDDETLLPRCETPAKYQDKNVFDVLETHLDCDEFSLET